MTEFFSSFPTITYNKTQLKDLTVRLDFIKNVKSNVTVFEYFLLRDGQRPEDVATIYYGNPHLYWIVLFINDKIDPYYDWLLTDDQLYKFVVNKYGVENLYTIHHYETTSQSDLGEGVWVNQGTIYSTPVSNYTYEQKLNEEKRKIKLLKRSYLQQVISEYHRELHG